MTGVLLDSDLIYAIRVGDPLSVKRLLAEHIESLKPCVVADDGRHEANQLLDRSPEKDENDNAVAQNGDSADEKPHRTIHSEFLRLFNDPNGLLLLHMAAEVRNAEVLSALLSFNDVAHIDVDAKDVNGRTPLLHLIETHGGDFYSCDLTMTNPSTHSELSVEDGNLLRNVRERSDIKWLNDHASRSQGLPAAAVAITLIERGADVDAADSNGVSPLELAIRKRWVYLTTVLLFFGADPFLPSNPEGHTAVHVAVRACWDIIHIFNLVRRAVTAQAELFDRDAQEENGKQVGKDTDNANDDDDELVPPVAYRDALVNQPDRCGRTTLYHALRYITWDTTCVDGLLSGWGTDVVSTQDFDSFAGKSFWTNPLLMPREDNSEAIDLEGWLDTEEAQSVRRKRRVSSEQQGPLTTPNVDQFDSSATSSVSALHLLIASAGQREVRSIVNTVRRLVRQCGVPVDQRDEKGRTALHFAAFHADVDVIKCLLSECGANPLAVDGNGRTVFHYLLDKDWEWEERHESVCEALSRAISAAGRRVADFINTPDADGRTALFAAFHRQEWVAVATLTAIGGDISRVVDVSNSDEWPWLEDEDGASLLAAALRPSKPSVYSITLAAKTLAERRKASNDDSKTKKRCAFLRYLLENSIFLKRNFHDAIAVVKILVKDLGEDPLMMSACGETALHVFAKHFVWRNAPEDVVQSMLRLLLGGDGDGSDKQTVASGISAVNARDAEGHTALFACVFRHRDLRLATLLMEDFNADPSICDAKGNSLLHFIVCDEDLPMGAQNTFVRLLISKGAPFNQRDVRYGLTPLHYAVLLERKDFVCTLLDAAASTSTTAAFELVSMPIDEAAVSCFVERWKLEHTILQTSAHDDTGTTPPTLHSSSLTSPLNILHLTALTVGRTFKISPLVFTRLIEALASDGGEVVSGCPSFREKCAAFVNAQTLHTQSTVLHLICYRLSAAEAANADHAAIVTALVTTYGADGRLVDSNRRTPLRTLLSRTVGRDLQSHFAVLVTTIVCL